MITKQSHPKSFEKYKKHIISKALTADNVKNFSIEVIESVVNDNMVALSLGNWSRDLYDFLDSENIIVSVWNPGQGWRYRVADSFPMESSAIDRKEAEKAAFTEAFNRLEKI